MIVAYCGCLQRAAPQWLVVVAGLYSAKVSGYAFVFFVEVRIFDPGGARFRDASLYGPSGFSVGGQS